MSELPTATLGDTLAILGGVVAPNLAKGVIIRRRRMVALAERLGLDGRAVRQMQRLRDRYGAGPLLVRLPGRTQAIILAPEHVRRVLGATPEPFAAASSEKRAALSHFQPHGVLISQGAERADRRRFNEAVLESDCPRHQLAARFVAVVREESAPLLALPTLDWAPFAEAWFRVVRRVTLGDGARDDRELTDMLARLRGDANWAFMRPKRRGLRARFLERLAAHMRRAEPGSLASMVAATPATPTTDPVGQVPQWLFAFDAAGIAAFRMLAVLATHAEARARARAEIAESRGEAAELPFLRACVLESVRLWPTTPLILRQTTSETTWEGGTMPAGTGVLIFVPYFHRDDVRLPFADRFLPDIWLGEGSQVAGRWPLIPFSGGPAECPGRQVVLLLASHLLSALLGGGDRRLVPPPWLDPAGRLPGTLDHFGLRFAQG
jgi:cytochrome P450